MRFFRAKTEEDFMSVSQTNPAINEAWGVIKVLSGDERARALAEYREKSRMDLEALLDDAEQKGEYKGVQKVARNLLRQNMSYENIGEATGLSLDEIKRLADDLDT
jgi:predicted transposase/invertase (TIGR01784 family)